MLFHAISTLALATAALSHPRVPIVSRDTSASFLLHVYANPNLSDWVIKNVHSGPAVNVLEIQRPSSYGSDAAYLSGSASQISNGEAKLAFVLDSNFGSYETVISSTPNGVVEEVSSELNAGSAIFGLNNENILTTLGNGVGGFWACPTNVADEIVFTLWYGVDVAQGDLPDPGCQSIQLQAQFGASCLS